jgi:hypothetical protein
LQADRDHHRLGQDPAFLPHLLEDGGQPPLRILALYGRARKTCTSPSVPGSSD